MLLLLLFNLLFLGAWASGPWLCLWLGLQCPLVATVTMPHCILKNKQGNRAACVENYWLTFVIHVPHRTALRSEQPAGLKDVGVLIPPPPRLPALRHPCAHCLALSTRGASHGSPSTQQRPLCADSHSKVPPNSSFECSCGFPHFIWCNNILFGLQK